MLSLTDALRHDIVIIGAGLAGQSAAVANVAVISKVHPARILCAEAPEAIRRLENWGAALRKRLAWTAALPWLDDGLRRLFQAGLDSSRSDSNSGKE